MSPALIIRMLGPSDASVLSRVAQGVFDNAIDPRWTAEFLADPRHHMAVALLGEQVVGMASAVHYAHPDKPPELWVNEVGVAPSHQAHGIGKQLLQAYVTLQLTADAQAPRSHFKGEIIVGRDLMEI